MSNFDPYAYIGITLNPDGTLTRHVQPPKIKPNTEPAPDDDTISKDIDLNKDKNTWVRVYRPTRIRTNDNDVVRLPILIYFHGGGWIFFTADDIAPHKNCVKLSTELPAIVVSVNYRLAPESRLPEQYHDSMDAITWVMEQVAPENQEGEQWLRDYGDCSSCYLYGCGSGGNIAFFAGVNACNAKLGQLRIAGCIMNQPMFGGIERTESELKYATDQLIPLPVADLMWELALPKGFTRDHSFCNPMLNGPRLDKFAETVRCLVIGFGGDLMFDRQQDIATFLAKNGVQVVARFEEYGFHCIDMIDNRWGSAVMHVVKEFIL